MEILTTLISVVGGPAESMNALSDSPVLLALGGGGGLGAMLVLVRWMMKFQQNFTNFYIAENTKLREEMQELREENQTKNDALNASTRSLIELERKHEVEMREMRRVVDDHARTIADHEETIRRLNRIIDRRKLED